MPMNDRDETVASRSGDGDAGPWTGSEATVPEAGTDHGPEVWDPRTGRWARPDELGPVFEPTPPSGDRGSYWRPALAGGIAGAAIATVVVLLIGTLFARDRVVVERQPAPPVAGAEDDESRIVAVAARARPWVVNVNVAGTRGGLFGSQVVQGTGSGVIVRSDGHVITNAHMVGEAREVEVTIGDGDQLPARVVGVDPDTDIAVVKVDRTDLPSAVIGTVEDLQVGELAVAIGSPLGLQQTVTAGIVSALGRTVARPGQPALVDMIQTDAAVTQGNSGGALIDGDGALVGINTAIAASPQVGAEGIAFAIPIDIAKAVADQLIETGTVTHPWIGIAGGNIDAETARQFGIGEGALVLEVVPDGPADRAGLRPRDIIVGFDGETIESMDELVVEIRKREVGDTVPVEIVRDGDVRRVRVTLGDRPDDL